MIYEMKLNELHFEKIITGKKTMVYGLFDNWRRLLNIGDRIIFENIGNSEQRIAAVIKSLHRYASFEDMLIAIPVEKWGNASTDSPREAAIKMNQYYTIDQIQKYGVIAIDISLIDLAPVVKDLQIQKETEFERLFPDGMK